MEEDDVNNSVHGRLVQKVGGDSGDASPNHVNDNKLNSGTTSGQNHGTNDCRVDITILPKSAPSDRRRQTRSFILCFILLVTLTLSVGIAVLLYIHQLHSQFPVAHTRLGKIVGRYVPSPQGQLVEQYLGIPFAKPPLKLLRYADPQALDALPSDPYEANDFQSSCMQQIDKTYPESFQGSDMWNAKNNLSEDCLYLNIWAPVRSRSSQPKTVMVWIYGGGFYSGSNSLWIYDGKALAVYGDVIIVSLNYRVGTFGYLSTGDGKIKGNFGMKDQVMALNWIQNNIAAFGGDPNSVTIFGESSGASSAGLHQMSEHSEKLFIRAIYQSGSPDSHWSFMTDKQARERSAKFFKAVNCTMPEIGALLICLRDLSTDTIMAHEWVDTHFMVFPWVPSVDGDFLADTPYNMLKSGRFQEKDALLGVNQDEGTYWLLYAMPEAFQANTSSLHTYTMYEDGVDQVGWDLNDGQRYRIKKKYSEGRADDGDANRDALDKVSGDRAFTCPTEELAEFYERENIKTYFYYLRHRSSTESWPPWMGVIHGADIQWIFGMPLNSSRGYTKEEVEFSQTLMSYWVNFAKTGDPNQDTLFHWPRFRGKPNPSYLEFRGPNNFAVVNTFRSSYCSLWRNINDELRPSQN